MTSEGEKYHTQNHGSQPMDHMWWGQLHRPDTELPARVLQTPMDLRINYIKTQTQYLFSNVHRHWCDDENRNFLKTVSKFAAAFGHFLNEWIL